MPQIEQSGAALAAANAYPFSMNELTTEYVLSPTDQAQRIALDCEDWTDERRREGFTPIAYFFNTGQRTPKYGLMFSANSGYMPINPEGRKTLEGHAKDGLDIVFYQCMSSFPGGFDTDASAGLAAYETVAYWAGAMKSLEKNGYDVRAIIVDEASALLQSSSLGLSNGNVQATVSNLRGYLSKHGAEDKVLVRPMADMFASPHATALNDVDVHAIRASKTEALESIISNDQQTLEAARVRLLLGQLTARGAQELGLEPYLGDSGVLPEEMSLSTLPRSVIGHIVNQVVELDTRMALRGHLIEDAQTRGSDLPELGVPGRHVLRVGTTKTLNRPVSTSCTERQRCQKASGSGSICNTSVWFGRFLGRFCQKCRLKIWSLW